MQTCLTCLWFLSGQAGLAKIALKALMGILVIHPIGKPTCRYKYEFDSCVSRSIVSLWTGVHISHSVSGHHMEPCSVTTRNFLDWCNSRGGRDDNRVRDRWYGTFSPIVHVIAPNSEMLLVILIPIARAKVEDATKGSLTVSFGNAAWMTLAAAIVLWFGVIGASAIACGCCGCGKRRG